MVFRQTLSVVSFGIVLLAFSAIGTTAFGQSSATRITAAQQSVKEALLDPASARFRYVRAVGSGTSGFVCGEVNAKNRVGGYTGFRRFIVTSNEAAIEDGSSSQRQAGLPELFATAWKSWCGPR